MHFRSQRHFPAAARVLDIGGGTGSWSLSLAAADSELTATVFEIPEVAAVARDTLRASGFADRVDVHEGDVLVDEVPHGYNAFLLANLVHYFTPDTNLSILQRIRAAAEPGSRVLIADFWTDATHTQPLAAALMAGEFAIHVNDGDVYSVDEGTAWLADSGWKATGHAPLAGPISLVTAEAV